MNVGFTGTQQGMTRTQIRSVGELLTEWFEPGSQFHHGDCVGADVQAAEIAKNIGYEVHCHPPINTSKRGYFFSDVNYKPKDYLDRNHDIVDAVEQMLATPKENEEVLRSGTWATIRYASKTGKRIYVVSP